MHINNHASVISAAALLLLAPLPSMAVPSPRPNIVVILADDQRAQDLGIAGHPVVLTPHIDALAERGVYFTEAFVTTAACTPSRTSILLGQYERKHGVTFGSNSSLTENAFTQTYPMVLKNAGYFTGYVGKNHTPAGKGGYKSGLMEKEFDYWYGGHRHLRFYPKKFHNIFKNAQADTQVEILDEGTMNFLTPNEKFIAGARDFLEERPADKPFCLLVNFNVPHTAGTGSMKLLPSDPKLYRTTYRDQAASMPIPETYVAKKDIKTPKIPLNVYNGKYISGYNYVWTLAALREQEIRECQTITGIDRLVGHLVGELERLGLADNTIIVYFSDHGIQHGEYGLGGKVLLYDPSIRVPFIIVDPRLPSTRRGKRVSRFALSIDIAPTLLDLCGVKPPSGIQGRSLAPLMRGKPIDWRKDFFCENMFMGQNYPRIEAVRNQRFKYIRYFDKKLDEAHIRSLTASIRGEKPIYEELFDLKNDPLERSNLAGVQAHEATLVTLRHRCGELVSELRGNKQPDTYRIVGERNKELTTP